MPSVPTVYVTLGTVFNDARTLFGVILEGLRDEPVNVIVTVGKASDPAALGAQPPSVHVERYLPQTQLFSRCDAIVSHGGSGTMLSALAAGLPLLSIPQGADQFRNAERCRTAGVGSALWPHEVSAGAVRQSVRFARCSASRPFAPPPQGCVGRSKRCPPPVTWWGVLQHLVA